MLSNLLLNALNTHRYTPRNSPNPFYQPALSLTCILHQFIPLSLQPLSALGHIDAFRSRNDVAATHTPLPPPTIPGVSTPLHIPTAPLRIRIVHRASVPDGNGAIPSLAEAAGRLEQPDQQQDARDGTNHDASDGSARQAIAAVGIAAFESEADGPPAEGWIDVLEEA